MRLTIIKKITFLLALMLALAIANVVVVYYYQIQAGHDSHIVNVAARQRVLLQAIEKSALSVANGNDAYRRKLAESVRDYDSALKAMLYGGEALGRHIPPTPIMKAFFQRNSAIWEPFKKKAEIVVREIRYNPSFMKAITYIKRNNEILLKRNNAVVTAYDNLPNAGEYAHEINIAGRQRMLSQKMFRHALAIAAGADEERKKLLETIQLHEKSFLAMRDGGVSSPMGKEIKIPPSSVKAALGLAEDIWFTFKTQISIVQKEPGIITSFSEALDYMQRHIETVSGIGSLITQTLNDIFSRKILFLRRLLLAMLGMDILIFIAGYLMAVKMVNPLKDLSAIAKKLGSGDFSTKAPVVTKDEIGELAVSFNRMTEDLEKTGKEILSAKDYTDNIIRSMIDMLIVVDPDARIKTINKAVADLLGYSEEELIGKPVATIFEEEDFFKGTQMEKLIKQGSLRDYEMTYKTKSGEKIPVNFSGAVMRDKEGKLLGIVGIARDMREIKHLMQKEKEFVAEAAIEKKKVEELDKAYTQLQDKTRRLGKFQKITVDREMAMVELKKEINSLLEKSGQPKKYEAPEKIKKPKNS